MTSHQIVFRPRILFWRGCTRLEVIGSDTLHLPMHIMHPEWASTWDSEGAMAAETRRIVERIWSPKG
jgi:hypothetical protein